MAACKSVNNIRVDRWCIKEQVKNKKSIILNIELEEMGLGSAVVFLAVLYLSTTAGML